MAVVIIIAQSKRQVRSDDLMPASERYQGIYFRVLRKYLREGKLRDAEVLIVTESQGVVRLQDPVPYGPLSKAVAKGDIEDLRRRNLDTLERMLSKRNYSEVYVNCGKDFLRLIDGFEALTPAKVTFAQGSGLGPKAAHMKKWIIEKFETSDSAPDVYPAS